MAPLWPCAGSLHDLNFNVGRLSNTSLPVRKQGQTEELWPHPSCLLYRVADQVHSLARSGLQGVVHSFIGTGCKAASSLSNASICNVQGNKTWHQVRNSVTSADTGHWWNIKWSPLRCKPRRSIWLLFSDNPGKPPRKDTALIPLSLNYSCKAYHLHFLQTSSFNLGTLERDSALAGSPLRAKGR